MLFPITAEHAEDTEFLAWVGAYRNTPLRAQQRRFPTMLKITTHSIEADEIVS
jgi:hypothetical protein